MTTALLIVDMQNSFVQRSSPFCIQGAQDTVPRVAQLLAGARGRMWLVVHVVRQHRADGSDVEWTRRETFLAQGGYAVQGTTGAEIIPELQPTPNEHVIVKPRFSAFFQTNLDSLLRRHQVHRLVVCGTQYPNCIRATAFDGLSLDYDVVVASDATSAQSQDVALANVRDLQGVGIRCLPVEEIYRKP